MRTKRFAGLVLFFGSFTVLTGACASIPDVTFKDLDGEAPNADGASPDGAQSTADGSTGGSDGGNTTDSSSSKDSGTAKDGGNPCNAGTNDICCGTQVCHNCNPSDCTSCLNMDCPGQGNGEICCVHGGGLTCRTAGTGGC
jgi:hypothetical protein